MRWRRAHGRSASATRQVVLGVAPALAGAFDFGFLALAAPALDADLRLGAAYRWLFGAGSFAYAAAVMPAGAAAVAPHRLLAAGLALCAAGAAAVTVAPSAAPALAGRVLFGLGGGVAAAPALALLAGIEDPAARRAGFARLGGVVAGGFTAGVLLAGLAVPAVGWRPVLAVAAVALAGFAWLARRSPAARAPAGRVRGAGVVAAATVAVTAALATTGHARALAAGAAALLGVGAWRRARCGRGWRSAAAGRWACVLGSRAGPGGGVGRRGGVGPGGRAGPAAGTVLAACLAGAATTASGVGATVTLGRALPGEAGLVLGGFGLAVLPAIALARRLCARAGPAVTAGVGLALQGAALAAAAWIVPAPPALAAAAWTLPDPAPSLLPTPAWTLPDPAPSLLPTLAWTLPDPAPSLLPTAAWMLQHEPALLAAAIAVFGAGHVLANAGVADAVTAAAGGLAAPLGALLVTSQYAGGGVGSVVVLDLADRHGDRAGLLAAAAIACAGAGAAMSRPRVAQRAAPSQRASRLA